jgi:hypothetical protein
MDPLSLMSLFNVIYWLVLMRGFVLQRCSKQSVAGNRAYVLLRSRDEQEKIDRVSDTLTNKIISHFRSTCSSEQTHLK